MKETNKTFRWVGGEKRGVAEDMLCDSKLRMVHSIERIGGKDALGQMLEEGEVHRWDVTGGKYKSSNEGGEDHEGKILAANGKRPHMLDEGGIFHQGRIVAASGKSHHMLDEGGIFH